MLQYLKDAISKAGSSYQNIQNIYLFVAKDFNFQTKP